MRQDGDPWLRTDRRGHCWAGVDLAEADPARSCEALGRVSRDPGHPDRERAYRHLLALARGSAGQRARRFALHRLGEVGDPEATPVLLDALADPSLADARLLVLSALASCGDSRAIPALQALARDGSVTGVEQTLQSIRARW